MIITLKDIWSTTNDKKVNKWCVTQNKPQITLGICYEQWWVKEYHKTIHSKQNSVRTNNLYNLIVTPAIHNLNNITNTNNHSTGREVSNQEEDEENWKKEESKVQNRQEVLKQD